MILKVHISDPSEALQLVLLSEINRHYSIAMRTLRFEELTEIGERASQQLHEAEALQSEQTLVAKQRGGGRTQPAMARILVEASVPLLCDVVDR